MKKTTAVVILAMVAFLLAGNAFADKIDKAVDYLKVGEKNLAETYLQQAIEDDPTKESVHFRIGVVRLMMDDLYSAKFAFDNASNLSNGSLNKKIMETCADHAYQALANGMEMSAHKLFNLAYHYDQSHLKKWTMETFAYGKDYLNRGVPSKAYTYFRIADTLDESLGDTISNVYVEVGNVKDDDVLFMFYKRALEFANTPEQRFIIYRKLINYGNQTTDDNCKKFYDFAWEVFPERTAISQEAGERLDRIARQVFEPKDIFDPRVDEYIELAERMAEGVEPSVVRYEFGRTPDLKFKKGEILSHWIQMPEQAYIRQVYVDKNCEVYVKGKGVYKLWKGDKWPEFSRELFKIKAVDDIYFVMILKERKI